MPILKRVKGGRAHESKPSRLLRILPEIRFMIWAAVIVAEPIQLHGRVLQGRVPSSSPAPGMSPTGHIFGRSLSLDYPANGCTHTCHRNPKNYPRQRHPLLWLLTNRQIYNEAKSILPKHLTLHICQHYFYIALLPAITNAPLYDPAMVQSLSFCFKITIQSDLRDGFFFARAGSDGWSAENMACGCSSCYNTRGLGLGRTAECVARIPAFTQLKLLIFFECAVGQGNTRPIVGHFANGRPKKGKLYRPKNPIPLACVENPEQVEEFVARWLFSTTSARPLNIFPIWRKEVESVDIHFLKSHISHNPNNLTAHPGDKCWCLRRTINVESLEQSGLVSEIQKRLTNTAPR